MTPTRAPRLAGELTFILMLLAGSLFLLWTAYGISQFSSITSAGMFPMVAAAVLVCCALRILYETGRAAPSPREPNESAAAQLRRQLLPQVLWMFVLSIAVYMFLFERLGFLISSYLYLVVSMRVLGSRRWLLNMCVAALVLGFIYIVFQTVFSVVLPVGTWWQEVK
jgi:putative tricarboxylic transport membrane protein